MMTDSISRRTADRGARVGSRGQSAVEQTNVLLLVCTQGIRRDRSSTKWTIER